MRETSFDSFLDETFLVDRETTIRQYVERNLLSVIPKSFCSNRRPNLSRDIVANGKVDSRAESRNRFLIPMGDAVDLPFLEGQGKVKVTGRVKS
jgi:hypothetical protein